MGLAKRGDEDRCKQYWSCVEEAPLCAAGAAWLANVSWVAPLCGAARLLRSSPSPHVAEVPARVRGGEGCPRRTLAARGAAARLLGPAPGLRKASDGGQPLECLRVRWGHASFPPCWLTSPACGDVPPGGAVAAAPRVASAAACPPLPSCGALGLFCVGDSVAGHDGGLPQEGARDAEQLAAPLAIDAEALARGAEELAALVGGRCPTHAKGLIAAVYLTTTTNRRRRSCSCCCHVAAPRAAGPPRPSPPSPPPLPPRPPTTPSRARPRPIAAPSHRRLDACHNK